MIEQSLQHWLSSGLFLVIWFGLVIISLLVLVRDFRTSNTHIGSLICRTVGFSSKPPHLK